MRPDSMPASKKITRGTDEVMDCCLRQFLTTATVALLKDKSWEPTDSTEYNHPAIRCGAQELHRTSWVLSAMSQTMHVDVHLFKAVSPATIGQMQLIRASWTTDGRALLVATPATPAVANAPDLRLVSEACRTRGLPVSVSGFRDGCPNPAVWWQWRA